MTTTRSQGLLSQDKTHLNIWNLRVERNTWRQICEEGLSRAVPMQRALTAKAACTRWAALGAETSRARCTLNKRKGQQRNTGEQRCARGQHAAVLVQVVSQGEGTVTELYWHSKLFSSTCTGVEEQLANREGLCVMAHAWNSSSWRLGLVDREFKTSLGNMAKSWLENQWNNKNPCRWLTVWWRHGGTQLTWSYP